MSTADDARQAIGRALSRLPSGIFVLTAGRGADATGMLVSFVQQVGFAPPALVVAVQKDKPITARVRRDGVFCLAVLDRDSRALMRHFARGFPPGVDAFAGLATATSSVGVPYPKLVHAHLACKVLGAVGDWSDHVVVCGEVLAGDGRLDAEPLVHVRKNGFHY